jgi:hypothetical protein
VKLPITITREGLTALIDAQAGTTNAVRVAELGLTATPFVAAPTLTALPGEFKRLSTIAGEAVSESVLHMVATDDAVETYTVTGIGLFLDNGDLFGVYSQDVAGGALFEKSEVATFLFAVDITFEAGFAALVEFGDTNFLYPPATQLRKGVAYLATSAEVAAGLDGEKIVTPATLHDNFVPLAQKGVANGVATLGANGKVPPSQLGAVDSIDTFTVNSQAAMLALAAAGPGDFARRTDELKTYVLTAAPPSTLANWVEFLSPGAPVRSVNGEIGDVVLDAADVGAAPATRSITGGGLATGGGSMAADRVITVAIASAAETLAGLINDKAVTPASLAGVLTLLLAAVPSARHVDTAGLATGGGDLSANRTITVPKATAADLEAGTDDTKALTTAALWGTLRSIGANGFIRFPGSPLIFMWGSGTHNVSHASKVYAFPTSFPAACFHVFTVLNGDPDTNDESDEYFYVSSRSQASFTGTTGGDNASFPFGYFAIGM